jgi:succinyl-diaminopimelate desuccinylase
VGEKGNWQFPPFSAETASGKMYGRGVADSKVAAAIFCHVAKRIHEEGSIRGSLHVLLDGYEHTGEFGGAKAYIELKHMKPSFVAVGYPGNENILIGARGFFRACVRTFGKEQHSGSRSNVPSDNPILKMATLIQWLSKEHLPDEIDQEFSFGPKVSVTSVSGGRTFSQIPDLCEARIDIRLTPNFGPHQAHSLLENVISKIDAEFPGKRTTYERVRTWPCFKLSRDSKAVTIFKNSAESIFGKTINLNVSGPSNIGNYLAEKHIPATCGFGVSYENLHTANESIRLDTILPVYETYLNCVPAWAENLEFERPDARQPNCIFEALNPTT